MVQLGDIIEIESSPEPIQSRKKGKGKAHPNGLASSVIELTDSEAEPDIKSPPSRSQTQVLLGHSSLKRKRNTSGTLRPSGSLDTPPAVFASASGSGTGAGPSKQQHTPANAHARNHPLFLTSDEEHEPPSPVLIPTPIGRDIGVMDDAPVVIPTVIIPETDPQPHIPAQADPQPLIPAQTDPQPFMPPPTPPTPDIDPTSTAVARILEIIPNVEPTHLLTLVETHLPTFSVHHDDGGGEDAETAGEGEGAREATVEQQVQGVVGHVLHLLFEDPNYPKAQLQNGKGKGKRVTDDEDNKGKGKGKAKEVVSKKPKIDYSTVDRPFPGGPNYFDLALYHLQTSFPLIPKPYLRRQFQIHKNLYAPTHLSILAVEKRFEDEGAQKQRPYILKSCRATLRQPQGDVALEEEKAWLDVELAGGAHGSGNGDDAAMDDDKEEAVDHAVMDDADDEEDDGTGIECQCCFADYPFSKMVQCPEAHLFCSTCISTYAATQLGAHNSSLTCIHSSSCSLPFPPSELKRILSVKLYELYERLEQQKQIMQAGLEGLEECPFCEWKCVLEVSSEEDKLFRCGNDDGGCGVVSCRGCKKLDHLPKSCKEVEEDKHLDGRHAIEEAMTRALMRNCPKCQKAFIKEQGCNKMSCPNCHTLSCYVCRQVINGYDHFNQLKNDMLRR
ncbi:hypothetical protein BYT27DRAFT_6378460 [Phlegmacium glaucopus]|nr:hypothetical protein BYT27DRAFT_6378460 [Phlegmacium glaucopus]